ncbi:MAG TPA: hypothetical protein VJ596_08955 [Gemmatimonadaceae bacterium]|nr:hypothetical protein [Gemmatimonadaceae bacterium]
MSGNWRIGPNGREDPVTAELRELYAPPADADYWRTLEARILARIAHAEEWWQPYGEWVRVGLLAAGLSALLAGLALVRSREAEARMAYETIIETPRTLPHQLATETSPLPASEATLRYVISP